MDDRSPQQASDSFQNNTIVLFDGVCNLCNEVVQFLVKRDPEGQFRFASLQSEAGQKLLREHTFDPAQRDTVIVIDGGRAFSRSDAALRIARRLGGRWTVLSIFGLVPRLLRDAVYDFIAANRYRWFGKMDQCMVPTPEQRSRFLE